MLTENNLLIDLDQTYDTKEDVSYNDFGRLAVELTESYDTVHKVGACESEPEKDNLEELETVIIWNTKEGKQSRIVTVDAKFQASMKTKSPGYGYNSQEKEKGIKEKRLLKFQEKLVMTSGLPPSRDL